MRLGITLVALLFTACFSGAASKPVPKFSPDPASVQRYGPAWRYPQDGWIVLHIEGKPYERGVQHGRLMASEIAAYIRCFAAQQSSKAPSEGWKATRTLVNSLFLRRFDKEFLEEMQGIADGASAVGAKFDGRAVDLVDIVAINAWAEVESLESALELTPNGLEGLHLPKAHSKPSPPMDHCSAFAATGPATADGKIVFGHITMAGLYSSRFYNVWLDIKPTKGHRIVMQSYPGGIQSGMDYYINDAGLIVCETTIDQTAFNPKGSPLTSRIRKAMQYSDSIDQVVETLKEGNNGLYSNEWLLADIKTNEIAMLDLGTEKSKLWRSSKKEWFADTEGFYWGCNNAKDLHVRMETIRDVEDRPANMVWKPSDRDRTWMKFYQQHKGRISAELGQVAFATAPICASSSGDAKITSSSLAKNLKSLALFGPPLGKPWLPTDAEKHEYSEIVPLVTNPWTLLEIQTPPETVKHANAVDLSDKVEPWLSLEERLAFESHSSSKPAWHGTILPKTDDDVWLATAFAEYERIVAVEHAFLEGKDDAKLSTDQLQFLTLLLYRYRCDAIQSFYLKQGSEKDFVERADWIRGETGKGVMRLSLLRGFLGKKVFDELMDGFGKQNAGKTVTVQQFQDYLEKSPRKPLGNRLRIWDSPECTPSLTAKDLRRSFPKINAGLTTATGIIAVADDDKSGLLPYPIELFHEHHDTPVQVAEFEDKSAFMVVETDAAPQLILARYQPALWGKRPDAHVMTFQHALDECLIVYGTLDDTNINKETAVLLQETIRKHGSNITVPILADRDVKAEHAKGHHLLLVGLPLTNQLAKKCEQCFPITVRSGSFTVDKETFAHPGSAVIAAASHPNDPRYSLLLLAGLSNEALYQTPTILLQKGYHPGQVLIAPHGSKAKNVVLPPSHLKVDFSGIPVDKK